MAPYICRATQTTPRWDLLDRCSTIAVDVEFQRVLYAGAKTWTERIGRIALIDENLNTIYDVYAAYRNEEGAQKGLNPKRFGVVWNDLKHKNGAVPAEIVERNCRQIFEGRTIVMHASRGDMRSFRIEEDAFAGSTFVDTQSLYRGPMGLGHPPSLVDYSAEFLGRSIQTGEHSPVEDSCATMELYLLHKAGTHFEHRARLQQQRQEAYLAGLGGTLNTSEYVSADTAALAGRPDATRGPSTVTVVVRLQLAMTMDGDNNTIRPRIKVLGAAADVDNAAGNASGEGEVIISINVPITAPLVTQPCPTATTAQADPVSSGIVADNNTGGASTSADSEISDSEQVGFW